MPDRDIRIQPGWPDHPKTQLLIDMCGYEGAFCLIRLWLFAAENHPKGVLKNMTEGMIERAVRWSGEPGGFVAALAHTKFISRGKKNFSIKNWREHQRFIFYAKERQKASRKANDARLRKKRNSLQRTDPVCGSVSKPQTPASASVSASVSVSDSASASGRNAKLAEFRQWKEANYRALLDLSVTYDHLGGSDWVASHTRDIERDIILKPEKYANHGADSWGRWVRVWLKNAAREQKHGDYGMTNPMSAAAETAHYNAKIKREIEQSLKSVPDGPVAEQKGGE